MMAYFSTYFLSCVLIFSFCLVFGTSEGLECNRDRKNFLDQFSSISCPPMFGDSDDKFCCETSDGSFYCCDFDDFAKSKGVQFLIPVVIGIVIGILAGCFLCCLCCPCCMLYKRRHQGTVYGRVQQPAVVNIQTHAQNPGIVPSPAPMPMPMPMPMPQSSGGFVQQPPVMPYPQYPATTVDYTGQSQVPPPPYSAAIANEVYAKQAPYNPNFCGN